MSTFVLKIIAMVSMLIDHIGYLFLEEYIVPCSVCRAIGRLAFPIFCFLIVEGFFRTHSLKKYFLRLGILAVVSEAAYDFAFSADFLNFGENIKDQNVVITLIVGLLAVTVTDKIKEKYLLTSPGTYTVSVSLVIILASLVGYFFRADYGAFGVTLIICLYFFRDKKIYAALSFPALCVIFRDAVMEYEIIGVCAFIPIFFFNGKKGPNDHHLFYLFYPAHMVILGLINMFLVKPV